MNRRKLTIVCSVLAVLATVMLGGSFALRSFLYPKPGPMPAIVSDTTEQLLTRLEAVMQQRAPEILRTLQPGLSESQMAKLETEGDFKLTADLRVLYRWRNGMKASDRKEFIPGHRWPPLEEVVAGRLALRSQHEAASITQKIAFNIFAGHRKDWVHILDDTAGDGYFYDPNRSEPSGEFFYCFVEVRHYIFFPSLRNFLKGVADCYEQGVFKLKDDGVTLDENSERAERVWRELGAVTE